MSPLYDVSDQQQEEESSDRPSYQKVAHTNSTSKGHDSPSKNQSEYKAKIKTSEFNAFRVHETSEQNNGARSLFMKHRPFQTLQILTYLRKFSELLLANDK